MDDRSKSSNDADHVLHANSRRGSVRILHLEDSLLDADLAVAHLQRDGLPVQVTRATVRP